MNSRPEARVVLPKLHADQWRAKDVFERYPRFVLRAGRRWGKSALLQTLACESVIHGGYVGIFTPDYRISAEMFNEMAGWLEPIKSQSSKVEGVIRAVTGGRIDFWTLDNERAGRSRKYDLAIFDEVAFNKSNVKEIWERSIEPTLLDRAGRAIFASNTNGVDAENFFYELHGQCETTAEADRHGVKVKLGYGEFHAPTRNNPYVPERLPGETLESHRARRYATIEKIRAENHPQIFSSEYEAEFVDFSGVSFFDRDKLLDIDGQPVAYPAGCDGVFATIDTATKTGRENDGTAVCYWALTNPGFGPHPLVLLDWDYAQIEGSLLEAWLPTVFQNLAAYAAQCRARSGSLGAWIEDKASGMVLLQQARNRNWPATAIDSKLTAMGKSERAISASGYFHRGMVKFSRHAYEKVVTYKGSTQNHALTQLLGFRVGEKDMKVDDALDAILYGAAIGLGNSAGF